MFKETLLIKPSMTQGDLNKLEKSLQGRFTKIAKKFGKGVVSALTGGGIAGLALGLIDKLLNPLQATQDAIDRILHQGDDLVTNAKQFGTTAGKLAKLQGFAGATGLEPEQLNLLLSKFQASIAEAQADPTKKTSVRRFANDTDIVSAFFEFIQSIKKLSTNDQVRVQQEVFGEKQILKMADFLGTDFTELSKFFANIDTNKLDAAANKAGDLNDKADTIKSVQNLKDLIVKAGLINEGMINSKGARDQLELTRENQRIVAYNTLSTLSETTNKMFIALEKLVLLTTDITVKIAENKEFWSKLKLGRIFRSAVGIPYGKDD